MDALTKSITSQDKDKIEKDLKSYIDENVKNFKLEESTRSRKELCTVLLDILKSSDNWNSKIVSLSLQVLRIISRENNGVEQLVCEAGIRVVMEQAQLDNRAAEATGLSPEQVEVVVEATKVLCNIVLNHRHLAPLTAELGILKGLGVRLAALSSSHDLLFFSLRLLFLITACGPQERVMFRDECDGIQIMLAIIEFKLFGPSPASMATATPDLCPSYCKPILIDEAQCSVLCEVLKILFNQTLNWKDNYTQDELKLWQRACELLKVLLLSLPMERSKLHYSALSHCVEIIVNSPKPSAKCFLLLPDAKVLPVLTQLYGDCFDKDSNIDTVFDDYNMSAVTVLVNYLDKEMGLVDRRSQHLPTVLTALAVLAKGHRSIRRYIRSLLLPPLKEVKGRPDEGNSLKSRVIRLMSRGALGSEEVAAELLFILCKEKVSRLVKHTGYGNAAGLLMSRGLLGGGSSPGEADYSSDSGDSDTEEYKQTKDNINPVTAAPEPQEPSPLDLMTDEEKEAEAYKLFSLFGELEKQGIMKVMPVDAEGKPVMKERVESSSDSDDD